LKGDGAHVGVSSSTEADVADAITKKHAKNADTDLESTFEATFEKVANKDAASGYAGLSAGSKLATSQMPTATIKTTLTLADASDPLTTGTDKAPTLLSPGTLTITKVKLVVKTAPVGAAIIVDVNKGGTTIFTNQAHRPQIAAGATTGETSTIDVSGLVEDDKLTFDIDQVGSSTPGSKITVEVVTSQAVAFS
jgi:hypothetical protein